MDIALVDGTQDRPGLRERVDGPLGRALLARGARVERPVWHDPAVDWSRYDLAVVRTTWDYPARRDEFVAWAAATGRVTTLLNPPDVLRWNTHKSYLLELEERGAPVVPTAWLGRGDTVELAELLAVRGWQRAVVKPAVGAGSSGVVRVALDGAGPTSAELGPSDAQLALDALLADGDALVQPFLASVLDPGELSVVVVDGEPGWAVRKRPATGDYRVQERHGGGYHPEPLDAATADLARWIVGATGADPVLARVDLLADATGTLQLAEVELTEPDLYLRLVEGAAERVAAALLARAGR